MSWNECARWKLNEFRMQRGVTLKRLCGKKHLACAVSTYYRRVHDGCQNFERVWNMLIEAENAVNPTPLTARQAFSVRISILAACKNEE